jgi:hypothetical protein
MFIEVLKHWVGPFHKPVCKSVINITIEISSNITFMFVCYTMRICQPRNVESVSWFNFFESLYIFLKTNYKYRYTKEIALLILQKHRIRAHHLWIFNYVCWELVYTVHIMSAGWSDMHVFATCCSEHCWCGCCTGSKCDVAMRHRTYDPRGSRIYGAVVPR